MTASMSPVGRRLDRVAGDDVDEQVDAALRAAPRRAGAWASPLRGARLEARLELRRDAVPGPEDVDQGDPDAGRRSAETQTV